MERPHCLGANVMFQGEQGSNINIHDGTFIQHNYLPPEASKIHTCYNEKDGFSHLQAHVATSAFDSADKVDAPKCHPNTRLAVLDQIMTWILLTVTRTQWMLWLYGAAGAGKSAIARSIVERCLAQNIPIARFFFFRTDSTRNTIQPVVATLVYQLIQQIPDLLPIITKKIETNHLIFTMSLETQLRYLVFEPLRQLHRASLLSVVVLLFDGVDECSGHDDQTDLVNLIANSLSSRDLPVITFFGTRAESQLRQIFRSHDVASNLLQLALDDNYLPDADIRLFLNDKFTQIKTTHPFSHLLSETWPLSEHVEEIVDKSSGQFIYASVVIKFLLSPRRHPSRQLDIIRGLEPPGILTPFAQLDTLYRHIFSQIEDSDIHQISLILAGAIFEVHKFGTSTRPKDFLEMSVDSISVLLDGLTSILVYENREIRFLHASISDFLLDQSRSQDYHIERRFWCTQLSIRCLRMISDWEAYLFWPLSYDFLPFSEATAELHNHLLALGIRTMLISNFASGVFSQYLTAIQRLDFDDTGALYQNHLNVITQLTLENFGAQSDEISQLGRCHDISSILAQHAVEKGATGQESPTSDEQHIFHAASTDDADTERKIVTPAAAVDHDREAVAKKHTGNHSGKVKATLGRIFKLKWARRKGTTLPTDKSKAERVASSQK